MSVQIRERVFEEAIEMAKWSVAREFESFFQHLERGIKAVDRPDRSALLERLARARSIFGGIDRPEHFTEWLTPEEQLEKP